MPVRKFRSVEEMEDTVWLARDDPELWPTVAALWARSAVLAPRRYPPGVYKHRSITDANRLSEAWDQERIDALRGRSRPSPTGATSGG